MRAGRADYPETLVEGEASRSQPNNHSSTRPENGMALSDFERLVGKSK
jgi:hypothetical protein